MQLAYNESISAWENDEVPVGAVIVDNQEKLLHLHITKQENVKTPLLMRRCWLLLWQQRKLVIGGLMNANCL